MAAAFSVHLEGRAPMGSSIFIRRIAITIITTAVLFVVSLFSVFTISGFLPWTSWAAVHANFTTINVAHSVNETRSIKLVWAGVPIVSIFYIALTLALGEETRDAYRWIGGRIRKIPQWRPRPLVLLPLYSTQSLTELESRSQLATPPPKSLKSGWDDMLESEKKKPKLWSPSRKSPASLRTKSSVTGSLRTISRLPSRASTPSPSLRGTSTVCGEDDAFVKSTLDYLGSPVAKTLGISPPPLMIPLSPATSTIISPAPAYFSPSKPTHHALAKSPTSVRSSHDMPPSPRHVPSDVESVISSVFDASWPQPPPSPPRASSAASRYHTATSQPILTASSPDIGPRVASGTVPTHRHVRPFEGSSISSLVDFPALSQLRPKRTPSVKSVKSLIRTFSAEKVHDGRGPVIYMHVVNEVA
ncbi:hypothetical protein DXG01_004792 [Tephrocybe rancida]|nr:hypothetical protein DXG01_004792 [Tephrocybe rancida]